MGLRLPTPRRLTGFGVKPTLPLAPLYQYYWLYAAVEPATGEHFWLEMPRLDHLCFGAFLRELAREYATSLNVLVLDNAPAHIAGDLAVPENVVLLYLPPYSPELNPVERLWQDLKAQIDVFDTAVRTRLEVLRDHVAEIICRYTPEAIASLTGYTYLLDAVESLQF